MPWFKASDDLASKPETTRIPRAHRRAALGVWVLTGTWSAQQLTDGHIPEHMLEELSGTPEDAAWLVSAGFWEVVVDGWQFVEWAPDQPLRASVLEARRKNTEKVKNWRSRNAVTNPVANSVSNDSETLPPSRPVPTRPTSEEVDVHPAAERIDLVDEFATWWLGVPRKVARADALKAFKAARKKVDLQTLTGGLQRYVLATAGVEKQHLKMPAGWLRDERWNDEDVVITTAGPAAAASAARPVAPPTTCAWHPDYPVSLSAPCARCAREAQGLPEGADF